MAYTKSQWIVQVLYIIVYRSTCIVNVLCLLLAIDRFNCQLVHVARVYNAFSTLCCSRRVVFLCQ